MVWAVRTRTSPVSSPCVPADTRATAAPRTGGRDFCRALTRERISTRGIREIEKLIENTINPRVSSAEQRRQLELLRELNESHRQERDKNEQIEARIQSFELASRMQLEAAEAFDISREPESIRRMYGPGTEARQILIARRLVERGVRFVQAWVGNDWDHHQNLEQGHRGLARQCDQAIGALLKDLKQRGMLDDTLVIWGGEFGRTPTVELPMGLPNNRGATAATTTITVSPRGWPAAASRAGTCMARPTNSAFGRSSRRSTSTTCTPRFCTCSVSITPG